MPEMSEDQTRSYLPTRFIISGKVLGNPVAQLAEVEQDACHQSRPFHKGKTSGTLITSLGGHSVLVFPRRIEVPPNVSSLLLHPDRPSRTQPGRWLPAASIAGVSEEDIPVSQERCRRIRDSWQRQFTFQEEERDATGDVISYGLRPPQIGALFAILAHWKVSTAVATVVMPTGTGKTETMLALLTQQRLATVLVVVPTVALREQIAYKFITLGLLKQLGALGNDALYPVVTKLEHRPQSVEDVAKVFRRSNVVVANMQILSGCTPEICRAIASECSHLLIDEAHHIGAPTWGEFRRYFAFKPVIQFTATPFRTDGKHVDGKVIFNYPLGQAQQEGYFKPIRFREVWALDNEDLEIAWVAKDQLEHDLAEDLDHIVMARAGSITRAQTIHGIYAREMAEHNPVLIHSELTAAEKREALRKLRERETRVAVCVDMLGEGFDLPELKIAALHDVHKSLAITLQFTGRFTRVKNERIGDATMIANVANIKVNTALRELYSENPDWNRIIRKLGESAAGHQAERSDFSDSFSDLPDEVPIQTLLPKMSTVVYQTSCQNWDPRGIIDVVKEEALYTSPSFSDRHKVAWFVTREMEDVPWANFKGLRNTTWHLYLMHWDEANKLLFVNSSNNDSVHEDLAKAVAGNSAALVRSTRVYRSMHDINRFIPAIVGLKSGLDRNLQFMMLAGVNVDEGFDATRSRNKIKSNVFGRGYEAGTKVSIGCSMKGRIWSHLVADDILTWTRWCHHVGAKLLDDAIDIEQMFRGFIIPERVTERPPLVPLAIEWPAEFWQRSEESITVRFGEAEQPCAFYETSLELNSHEREGTIQFRVLSEEGAAQYEVRFSEEGTRYVALGREALLTIGKRTFPLSEWFRREQPQIYFERDASLISGELVRLNAEGRITFTLDAIDVADWTGIDIRKESQGIGREADSVQRRVIEILLGEDWDILFDDDASYEAADVIAIRMSGERLQVRLCHCKFSGSDTPGARIEDLYVVCGQGQKSVRWRENMEYLVQHMVNREKGRRRKSSTRFERGDLRLLADVIRKLPYLTVEFEVVLVQPGVSKRRISADQLELLSATRQYLGETLGIRMRLLASP